MATRDKNWERSTVVGVFENSHDAQRAVDELHRAGFTDKQIGVVSHNRERTSSDTADEHHDTYAEEGALTGALAGAGVGTAWAIGIAAGLLPAIGPVIAGGTLAAILASAAGAAAAGGIAGALVGMGIPEEEAEYYEQEFKSGRTVVSVRAADRYEEAAMILRRYNGHTQERSGAFQPATFGSTQTSSSRMSTGQASTSHMAGGHTATSRAAATPHASTRSAADKEHVQLKEEKLNVQKEADTGEVRVHKDVVTEHKSVDVPVQREEVVIHRHAASGETAAHGDIHAGEDIRIPVKEEHVRVEKVPVVKEEVSIEKRAVQDTERVDEDVKRERLHVEREGDVRVRGENER